VKDHPYSSAAFAALHGAWGEPLWVPEWETHVIQRPIPGGGQDGAGCYPLTPLSSEADLEAGCERLRAAGLVSLVLVLDPLARPPQHALQQTFDLARPFKTHYLVDPAAGGYRPSRHHRYEIRVAQRSVEARPFELRAHLPAWQALYTNLVRRKGISGLLDFPSSAFAGLAELPGLVSIGAFRGEELLSAHLWIQGPAGVTSHLAASSPDGYACRAAYAVYDASLRHFAGVAVNLGGGPGTENDPDTGLARFKRGFANDERQSWLCGKILDPSAYAELTGEGLTAGGFFPAYRRARSS